jgi:hypothetical protein
LVPVIKKILPVSALKLCITFKNSRSKLKSQKPSACYLEPAPLGEKKFVDKIHIYERKISLRGMFYLYFINGFI